MGIPAYFSYIIKQHGNANAKHSVLQSLVQFQQSGTPSILYMDSNSVVYDVIRDNDLSDPDQIIEQTIQYIERMIAVIQPTTLTYIAFDGVAPMAKMQQQRTRRFKSEFMRSIQEETDPSKVASTFSTSQITPGTPFMNQLSARMNQHFDPVPGVKVSTSLEPGEGEHKLMEHLRAYEPTRVETIAIYGLDSDLIMLALYHQTATKQLYVFREAPEFFKSQIPVKFQDPKEPYFINIHALGHSILHEMRVSVPTTRHVDDYVFMCFLLGNDFLPHFPALNLRTHGIQAILDVYRAHLAPRSKYLVDRTGAVPCIHWASVSLLCYHLAQAEYELLVQEYRVRDKWAQRHCPETTPEEREKAFNNVPVMYRGEETYIAPLEPGWETRYYRTLFHEEPNPTLVQEYCVNYLEGLEWVFKYYTTGCPDYQWKYKYHYPPLMRNLYVHVPLSSRTFLQESRPPCTEAQQLAYVLPKSQQPDSIKIGTMEEEEPCRFQWAFCRYFWESHLRN